MLFTVYDPKGEKFEVAPHIAKELIIEKGWSINPRVEVIDAEVFSSEESVIEPLEKVENTVKSASK